MNARPLLILAVLVAAIVGAAMWFLNSQPPAVLPPVMDAAPSTPVSAVPSAIPVPKRATPAPRRLPAATARPQAKKEPEALAEWEMKIDQILRTNAGEADTAQMLINMLPTLPAEGQAEAAQHITNLLLDEEYSRVLPLVRNPSLPEEVHDVFLTDLMNREDPVKLPTLLEIARQPAHPLHEEAAADLEVFLDEEYGNDWARWDAAVKKYLSDQQAEEAAAAATSPKEPVLTQ